MPADAPLSSEASGKQVVPGCPGALFCFADEWLTSSSQEQIVAARLARRPLLPTGVAEASAGLGGEAALSSVGFAGMRELSGVSSANVFRKRIHDPAQEMHVLSVHIPAPLHSESLMRLTGSELVQHSGMQESTKPFKWDNIFSNPMILNPN